MNNGKSLYRKRKNGESDTKKLGEENTKLGTKICSSAAAKEERRAVPGNLNHCFNLRMSSNS